MRSCTTTAQRLWSLALREMADGVKEIPGRKSHPRIKEYYRVCGLLGDEPGELGYDDSTTPWCGCGVGFLVDAIGLPLPKGPAAARNWLKWGLPTVHPSIGCIVVLSRGSNPRHGHVGLYGGHDSTGDRLAVLGGNQGNRWSLAMYDNARVLGYRIADWGSQ